MAKHQHVIVSKRLVAINSASSVLAKFVNFAVLLWVYQFLLRHLPPEEFAILPLIMSLMVFGPLFFSFFIGGIARYMIDAYAKGDFVEMRRVSSSLFPVLAGFSALVFPAGMLFAANIEKVFNVAPEVVQDARLMMALMIISFILQMVIVPFTTAYAITQKYVEKSFLEVGRDLVRAGLTIGLLLLLGPKVLWVVIAMFASETSMNVIMLWRSFRILPELRFERGLFSLSRAWELTSFGLWTTLGRLGSVMYTHAATLILNVHGTAVDVSAYHIGATFYRQTQSTINLAAMPLQPAITAMNALDDRTRLASTVFRGGRYALWASMLVATPLIIYSDVFIGLYLGPEYSKTALIVVLFMIIFPFTHPTILLPITAMATKHVRGFYLPAFLFQFGGLVLMLMFAGPLDFGAVGVCLALTVISIASQVFYFWGFCLRLTKTDFSSFAHNTLVRGLAPALVAGCVWAVLRLALPTEGWFDLIWKGAVGAAVYIFVLLLFCLDTGERRDLSAMTRKVAG